MNKIQLIGHVGKDPETKTFGDNSVTNFTLATSETHKDKAVEKQTSTEWHNCQVWGKLSDVVEKYVKKGTHLYAEGKIKTETWDDKDGNKKYKTVIVVNSIELLGGKPSDSNNAQISETSFPKNNLSEPEQSGAGENVDDSLPF